MKLTQYLRSLLRADSPDSSRSYSLFLSSTVGALVGLSVCFSLVWDVCTNGRLRSDLEGLGILLLCTGGYMAGGGIHKALAARTRKKNTTTPNPTEQ